ncbi:MAG: phosphocholine cytidylyltransferase family protein [Bradyrhizobium sp.]|uniref:phosphocholine cytidylyltransferase family protein n=1 Tax=Bradyrhizobium sp. TaxID=376 RepID=UPI001D2FE319|nr:phosphocholine cytidylyltransferase family protein [Bradyrhizobium sp.]MBV9563482.1 phosphocholine cytidylyltransferase family protein [Bradyrhizobium sp.]
MRTLILAAGRGQRVGDLTDDTPKCLLRVGNRTLLDRQLDALRAADLHDIAVVRGYCGHQLEGRNLPLIDNPDWQCSGICASLMTGRAWLDGWGGIVAYGDLVYTRDAVFELLRHPGDIVILYDPCWYALWRRRMPNPLSDAECFQRHPDGSLAQIGGTPSDILEVGGQYMGLLKFSAAGWTTLASAFDALPAPLRRSIDMTGMLQHLISREIRVEAATASSAWMEIDTAADLALCEEMIEAGEFDFFARNPPTIRQHPA